MIGFHRSKSNLARSYPTEVTDGSGDKVSAFQELLAPLFFFLAKVFEIAKPKYLGEHRELLPEQMHRIVLVCWNIDTARTFEKLGSIGRDDANVVLVEPGIWQKWLAHDDNGVGLRPKVTLRR